MAARHRDPACGRGCRRLPRAAARRARADRRASPLVAMAATGGLHLLQHQRPQRLPDAGRRREVAGRLREATICSYENLPQPTITDVTLDVDLYPDEHRRRRQRPLRADATDTGAPIREVHVRARRPRCSSCSQLDVRRRAAGVATTTSSTTASIASTGRWRRARRRALDLRDAALAARLPQRAATTRGMVDNGTFLNNFELRAGDRHEPPGPAQDRTKRRKYGLPAELRPAKLEDLSATRQQLFRRRTG